MDTNLQVAFVSVLATLITTSGVVAVAIINNRKERSSAAEAGVEAGLDEKDILQRMLSLISESERKDIQILALQKQIKALRAENTSLLLKLREREGP